MCGYSLMPFLCAFQYLKRFFTAVSLDNNFFVTLLNSDHALKYFDRLTVKAVTSFEF